MTTISTVLLLGPLVHHVAIDPIGIFIIKIGLILFYPEIGDKKFNDSETFL